MKITGIDFPQLLLDALDTEKLVVFAGAGVSMGPPAKLPDFDGLASKIADVTGYPMRDGERADRFLDRLVARDVDVHRHAADALGENDPLPTRLHRNLLRFFRQLADVRLVTSNFDHLFESAAKTLFESELKTFEGPALPLGRDFQGIIHVHGSLAEPAKMVLTYADFGRAYLTDAEGWARRFVRDLFTNWTVLFVGYSHSDPIMTYLTSALPPETQGRLFALVGECSGDLEHWDQMGIKPILFQQTYRNDFDYLNEAVEALSDHARRGSLGWQQYIGAIAGGLPPIDEESADLIEYALASPERTRFFVQSAKDPEWIGWLNNRGKLAKLFTHETLTEIDVLLSHWLAERFAVEYDGAMFAALSRHGNRVNSELWNRLAWHLGNYEDGELNTGTLARWVHFLMNATPPEINDFAVISLAETCAKHGALQSLLHVYELMTARRYQLQPDPGRDASLNRHLIGAMFWERCLEPHLPEIAHSLLDIVANRLHERHFAHVAWGEGNRNWDMDNWFRSAIEPHQQDDIPYPAHPLINVARDSLEWLATNRPALAKAWVERFADSEAPLLRRLAIHAAACSSDSADETIAWLLDRFDANELAIHHEVFRAAADAYLRANEQQRRALIGAIYDYQAPESDIYDKNTLWARHCFDWFHWLYEADPHCSIAKEALDEISEQYPEFAPSNHPDFTIWSETGTGTIRSPLSTDELLAKPAAEWLPKLLESGTTDREQFDGLDRWAVLNTVSEAARTSQLWGIELAQEMIATENWKNDLWQQLFTVWALTDSRDAELPAILTILATRKLQTEYTNLVADILSRIIQRIDELPEEQLRKADSIVEALAPYASNIEVPDSVASAAGVPRDMGWLFKAINHPAGKLALYWVHRIALWHRLQLEPPQSVDGEFRRELNAIVNGDDASGRLGRTILASQFHFMLATDEAWTVEHLLPLFDAEHEDFDCAWDGFLAWGRLSPPTAEHLHEKFIEAVPRIQRDSDESKLLRFIDFYVAALVWSIRRANDDWIAEFFRQADGRSKRVFATQLGRRLRELDGARQKEWWNSWLKDYWIDRLRGIPRRLEDAEIAEMLGWVLHLTAVFPEAVEIATQMRPVELGHSTILHLVGEQEVVKLHPEEFAKFLIHLGQCQASPRFWYEVKAVIDQVLRNELIPETENGLRELVAKHDLR